MVVFFSCLPQRLLPHRARVQGEREGKGRVRVRWGRLLRGAQEAGLWHGRRMVPEPLRTPPNGVCQTDPYRHRPLWQEVRRETGTGQ